MSSYKIAFFHLGSPCHGKTKQTSPLGGTESAMIDMAEALSKRGHEVHVFTVLNESGNYEGVYYHSFEKFESYSLQNNWDVFIGIRQLLPVLVKRWAKYQIYFTPDAYDQPFFQNSLQISKKINNQILNVGLYSLKFVSQWVDKIYCVGNWQAQTLSQYYQVPLAKFFVSGNGVNPALFKSTPLSERKKRIVYASTPFRGLNYLLDYFPLLKRKNPDLECWVMSGMQLYGLSKEEDQKEYSSIYQKAKQEGVVLLGPVSKPELYSIFSESLLMAYPNIFPETFCISVLEAQAAGLPVVTSRLAALEERVLDRQNGFLITGHPSEEKYKEAFCEKVNALIQDSALWNRCSEESIRQSHLFSYEKLAEKWIEDFDSYFSNRESLNIGRDLMFFPKSERFLMKNDKSNSVEINLEAGAIRNEMKKYLSAFGFNELKDQYELYSE